MNGCWNTGLVGSKAKELRPDEKVPVKNIEQDDAGEGIRTKKVETNLEQNLAYLETLEATEVIKAEACEASFPDETGMPPENSCLKEQESTTICK